MQFITSLPISLILASMASTVLANGGFTTSCINTFMVNQGTTLQSTCLARDGAYRTSVLDLSMCLGNDDGNLNARDNGGVGGSCNTCGFLVQNNADLWLGCQCQRVDGGWQYTQINLNGFVWNNDGHVGCFGHQGA